MTEQPDGREREAMENWRKLYSTAVVDRERWIERCEDLETVVGGLKGELRNALEQVRDRDRTIQQQRFEKCCLIRDLRRYWEQAGEQKGSGDQVQASLTALESRDQIIATFRQTLDQLVDRVIGLEKIRCQAGRERDRAGKLQHQAQQQALDKANLARQHDQATQKIQQVQMEALTGRDLTIAIQQQTLDTANRDAKNLLERVLNGDAVVLRQRKELAELAGQLKAREAELARLYTRLGDSLMQQAHPATLQGGWARPGVVGAP